MESLSTLKTSPIQIATTNVLTLANIGSVCWRKYTYTCPAEKLRSLITSASPDSNSSTMDDSIASLTKKGVIPLGDWHVFSSSMQKVYESLLCCKYNVHLAATNLIVQPIVKYKSLRQLEQSDLETPENTQAVLAPSGLRANLLSIKNYNEEDVSTILNEFKSLFNINVTTKPGAENSYLPPLVQVSITKDGITKEFPYPSQCVYIITEGNMSNQHGIHDLGMGPILWEKLGDTKNLQTTNDKPDDVNWWQCIDPLHEVKSILSQKNFHDVNVSSPTGLEVTMTPNTPGMINVHSSASSPGRPMTRSKKKPVGDTKAYPSPPDAIQPISTELIMPPPTSEDMPNSNDEMININPDFELQDYDLDIFDPLEEAVTDDDFKSFDINEPFIQAQTSLNYLTPAPEASASTIIREPTEVQSVNPSKETKNRVNVICVQVEKTNQLIPVDYMPLKFINNVDETKYLPGGKFYQLHNRKKRKRISYGPDLISFKKPKNAWISMSNKNKRDNSDNEYETGSEATCSTCSDSDSDSSDFETVKAAANIYIRNSRNLEFINAGRLTLIIDLHGLHNKRQLRSVNEYESRELITETTRFSLREQAVLGLYPSGVGVNGEGESTYEFLETHRSLVENLSGELSTASALPFEIDKAIYDFKNALVDISDRLPKQENHAKLKVNGPLTVQDYCNLNGEPTEEEEVEEVKVHNFQEFSTPDIIASAEDYLIETPPQIIKYWDTHNLTPYDGAKNVIYFVLYLESEPHHLRKQVEFFIDELRVQYDHFCSLGTHEPAPAPSPTFNVVRGLVPIQLSKLNHAATLNESELDYQIRQFSSICEKFGKLLVNIVSHFAKLRTSFKDSLRNRNLNPKVLDFIFPQVIPIDHIIRYSGKSFKRKSLIKELAFTVYTKSRNYQSPFILPKPSVVSVEFKLTKRPPPLKEIITYDTVLQMAYGYSFDQRLLIIVWVDMQGHHIGSDILHTSTKSQVVPKADLFKKAWNRTVEFRHKTIEEYRRIIVTKVGIMSKEEKESWLQITEGKVSLLSVDIESNFSIDPIIEVRSPKLKICGMVLNKPIPLKEYLPMATGYLLESDINEIVSNAIQVDLIHYPQKDENYTSAISTLWDILKQFNTLTYMEVTPIRACLPYHVVSIERLARAFVGSPT
ncbi:11625_t:CDS:10 [Diversispora eburnea]|uniref:Mediator of RNA polymerase II transcription subunit 13 n=1 Tax=Diversispora eburnea TaxID=1213867 RepID=A0A9N9EZS7_9GLOM|nr:11625_t:CDS:10 [Diversispora eburnea]